MSDLYRLGTKDSDGYNGDEPRLDVYDVYDHRGEFMGWLVPVVRCEHGLIDPHEYAEPCGEMHAEIPGHCGVTTLRDCPGSPTLADADG